MISVNVIVIGVLVGFAVIRFFSFPFDVSKCAIRLMKKHGDSKYVDDDTKKNIALTVVLYQYISLVLIIIAVSVAEYLICTKVLVGE